MRIPVYIFLFLAVLIAPLALRHVVNATSSQSTADAANTLIVVTPHNPDIRREFARAFVQWHHEQFPDSPPVGIDYRTFGGTNDLKRLLDATYRPLRDAAGNLPTAEKVNPDYDVLWGGGDYLFDKQLKPLGILQPIDIDPKLLAEVFPNSKLAGVRLYDDSPNAGGGAAGAGASGGANIHPSPLWIGVCLSSFGIVYNPDIYECLGLPAPKTWRDLTNPKLAGLVALADPTHSGSAQVAYMMVIQRCMADAEAGYFKLHPEAKRRPKPDLAKDTGYAAAIAQGWKTGMDELLLIAANARYLTDSATMVPTDVGNGEAAAGMAIDFYGRVEEGTVGQSRARYLAPHAAPPHTPDPVGILYGVKGHKLKLAMEFIAFLLSKQGQLLWDLKPGAPGGPTDRALRRPPIEAALYAPSRDRSDWADPEMNPFNEAGGFNQRGEWNALMADTTPLWAAAWIDDRESLRQAYRAVLDVPDADRREKLIAELADLPVTMGDVAALSRQAKALAAANGGRDLDEWRARQRIAWAAKFRGHFAVVAGEAAGI
jgi:ABC-type Fe3+ transport system substrate-binding protein